MSYFTDRWIKFKEEDSWGEWATPDTFPNYLLEWSATSTENKSEEDLIGGSRDWRKRVWLEEGVVARWLQELVSAKIYKYILGSRTGTGDTVSPSSSTYSLSSTLPSISVYRGLYPDESGGTFSLGYYGLKVDTSELTIEESGDVRLELNFAGRGVTIPSAISKPTLDMDVEAFAFHHSSIDIITNTGSTLSCSLTPRLVISTNSNLTARYSAGSGSYRPTELREGAFQVSGRITMSGQLSSIASQIINRTDNTIKAYLKKAGSTITFTLNNVTFDELPDEIRGLEPVEIEIPFVARPESGSDALTVVETSTTAYEDLPI